jgi:hypothetical protein
MKSRHVDDDGPEPEHRVTLSMTALEAALYLRDQPVVHAEVRARIRKALNGCDQVPK